MGWVMVGVDDIHFLKRFAFLCRNVGKSTDLKKQIQMFTIRIALEYLYPLYKLKVDGPY
jgi:hypothetical protein